MVKMGFLPNVFALNMSMQRHPNTHTDTHTRHTLCLLTHFGSTVKHLFDAATLEILDSYPYLPAKPEVVGLYWWFFGYFCLLCFICHSQLMLLYETNFDRINVLFWIFTLTMSAPMRRGESLYCWGKKKNVSRHDVTGFLPKRGNCHSVKLKWNTFSTHFLFCPPPPGRLSNVVLFPSFFYFFLCFKKKRICLSNLPFIAGHWLLIPGECLCSVESKVFFMIIPVSSKETTKTVPRSICK